MMMLAEILGTNLMPNNPINSILPEKSFLFSQASTSCYAEMLLNPRDLYKVIFYFQFSQQNPKLHKFLSLLLNVEST